MLYVPQYIKILRTIRTLRNEHAQRRNVTLTPPVRTSKENVFLTLRYILHYENIYLLMAQDSSRYCIRKLIKWRSGRVLIRLPCAH